MANNSATVLSTQNESSYKEIFGKLHVPPGASHKGQNGKVLIIGGSSLFHSAVIWPAEAASHFCDMVHICSTEENNEIIRKIKRGWHNGMVIPQKNIQDYLGEDDAVLIGNGMMRAGQPGVPVNNMPGLEEIWNMKDEGLRTYFLTELLLRTYPDKKWVIDAGALQMMDPAWLKKLKTKAIITPHLKEFEKLFNLDISSRDQNGKIDAAVEMALKFNTVILLKADCDIVTDGVTTYVIQGGNPGLTKGGTGDILAGITVSLYAKNNPLVSSAASSLLIKSTADHLSRTEGIWFNNRGLIHDIPAVMNTLMKQYNQGFRSLFLVDMKAKMK